MSSKPIKKLTRSPFVSHLSSPPVLCKSPKEKSYLLPPLKENKKTIIFDLDETLIHSHFRDDDEISNDYLIIETEESELYVSIRPGMIKLLQEIKNDFEIVLFTASNDYYADSIIDQLEKEFKLFDHKLYLRDCKHKFGYIFKDIFKLGRDVNKVMIFDDNPDVWNCRENVFIVNPYHGGNEDVEYLTIKQVINDFKVIDNIKLLYNKYHRYSISFDEIIENGDELQF